MILISTFFGVRQKILHKHREYVAAIACNARSVHPIAAVLLQQLSQLVDKFFALFPAKTRISDGFSVYTFSYSLAAVLDIAFYHEPLNHVSDIGIGTHGVDNLFGNPYLLQVLLSGVGMVSVHYDGRILKTLLVVHVTYGDKVLVMIVRERAASLVHITPVPISAPTGESRQSVTLTDYTAPDDCKVKAMVWDGLNTIVPYAMIEK